MECYICIDYWVMNYKNMIEKLIWILRISLEKIFFLKKKMKMGETPYIQKETVDGQNP